MKYEINDLVIYCSEFECNLHRLTEDKLEQAENDVHITRYTGSGECAEEIFELQKMIFRLYVLDKIGNAQRIDQIKLNIRTMLGCN